ncbi:MAG TPA: isopeptide-forming domain-containing fimbrial protein [Candidatus Saccharimonadales bacterium]|nr:isopeptide-forming domain-containing fimbrial protein [Candidatus Saccharimonadales bacterium]
MGKLINALKRLPKRTTALVAIVAAAIVVPATLFAWGPDRPTYTINNPADHITFNSITDNPSIGDERNFVGIRENGSNSTWSDNITVQPGKEYVVRMYVHNNAASSLNLVAQNVTAKVNLPTNTAKSLQVNGFINSTNASPQEVYDHAVMNSDKDFNLAYQAGTLKYFTNASGANGFDIPESVFTSAGAKLGYDKLDGKIPGCFQYAGYLTFVVKPQFATPPSSDFSVNKQVRKDGTGAAFAESTNVMPGDTVNYRIEVKNTGNATINNVIVKDKLPTGMTFVPGTVKILNANNPGGAYIQDGDKIVTSGVNIGAYSAGSNALVIFNAKVAANDQLPTCGPNKLTNIASAQPEGQNPKEDGADVNIPKECKPEAKYACDALTVTKIERTKFKFETKYTVENATLKGIQYVIRDEQGKEIARQSGSDYTQDKVGKYTVEAILTVTVDGQDKTVTSDACKKPFEVVKENTPGIVIEKKVDGVKQKQVGVDQEFTYQLVVTNTGEVDLTDSVVTDKAPAGVTFIKASAGTIANNAWTYTIASLKVGQSTSFTITAKVPNYVAGNIVNTACVDSPQVPGTPDSCDKATVEVPKPCVPGTDAACTKTPEIPSELPKTGTGDGIIAILGAGSLIAALGYYIASRRALSA